MNLIYEMCKFVINERPSVISIFVRVINLFFKVLLEGFLKYFVYMVVGYFFLFTRTCNLVGKIVFDKGQESLL